jgi:hypothetical protein
LEEFGSILFTLPLTAIQSLLYYASQNKFFLICHLPFFEALGGAPTLSAQAQNVPVTSSVWGGTN